MVLRMPGWRGTYILVWVPLSVTTTGYAIGGRGTTLICSPKNTARTPVIGGVTGGSAPRKPDC